MARVVNFPEEIIIEILSRLPVKSLIRFRSVSKSWKSLIIDPRFIEKHLNQSTKHNDFGFQRALLRPSLSSHVSCLSNNSISEAEKLPYPLERNTGRLFILSSCNGLFWIKVHPDMFLWNPSTRKIKKLPKPPHPIAIHLHENRYFPGFSSVLCYDSCNDDYKIVCILNYSETRPETMLYSLKTDSWIIVQDHSPYGSCTGAAGMFVNGACHWLKRLGRDSSASYVIVSFDLSKGKFGEVPFPGDLMKPIYRDLWFSLAVLRGMLCLHCNFDKRSFTLWAMEEYGVEKSWTKMFKFEYNNDALLFSPPESFAYLVPKFLFDNGELLLEARNIHHEAAIVKYKEQRLVFVVSRGLTDLGEMQIYPESLVSPSLIKET